MTDRQIDERKGEREGGTKEKDREGHTDGR